MEPPFLSSTSDSWSLSNMLLKAAGHLEALLERGVSIPFCHPQTRTPMAACWASPCRAPLVPSQLRADQSGRWRRTSHSTLRRQNCRGRSGELLCRQTSICLFVQPLAIRTCWTLYFSKQGRAAPEDRGLFETSPAGGRESAPSDRPRLLVLTGLWQAAASQTKGESIEPELPNGEVARGRIRLANQEVSGALCWDSFIHNSESCVLRLAALGVGRV